MASHTLKEIPTDVMKAIIEEQKNLKAKKDVRVYGIDLTVYSMIRELIRLRQEIKTSK